MSAPINITAADISFGLCETPTRVAGLAVDLAGLLGDVAIFLRRYVVLSDEQAIALTLWVAHTHAVDASECTPYLQVASATKRAGKTRLLEVLEALVARPWFTGRTSAAALSRKVDSERPTLLLDESDAAFNGEKEYAEALRGVLNTGYRRSGKSTVCVGQGTRIQVKDFSTFCPKAIAGIGRLPGTIADRSILIALRRKSRDEFCERWRERDGHAQGTPIRERLILWAQHATAQLGAARPEIPQGLGDRQADAWEPLLAIADAASGEWPSLARRAALALCGEIDDADINVELLHDIKKVFEAEDAPFISSTELAKKLSEMEDRPWSDWKRGKPITPKAIADRLRDFVIVPTQNDHGTARGYYRDRFEETWIRYPTLNVSIRQQRPQGASEPAHSERQGSTKPDGFKNSEAPTDLRRFDTLTPTSGHTPHSDAPDASSGLNNDRPNFNSPRRQR